MNVLIDIDFTVTRVSEIRVKQRQKTVHFALSAQEHCGKRVKRPCFPIDNTGN